MPTGDADWLALTPEPTLEPERPICDAHHHLWEFRPEPAPYQRDLLAELAENLGRGHDVRATVFIEVKARYRPDGPEDMRPVGAVEFVEGLATDSARGRCGRTRMAAAIIGYADLKLGERVTPVLDAMQAASPTRFRGVRHSVGWAPRAVPGEFALPSPTGGAGRVRQSGARPHHRPEPYRRSGSDRRVCQPGWRRVARLEAGYCAAVAACPNGILKLGGVGQRRFGFDWHTRAKPIGSTELAAALAPLMQYCIEQFGPRRCMFESNFPVDKVSYSYNVLYNAFKIVAGERSC